MTRVRPSRAPIGIVTGLNAERRLVTRLLWTSRGTAPAPIATCCGPGPEAAARAAAAAIADGATALASVGFAGGLRPRLGSGTTVVARAVVDSAGNSFACDPHWRRLVLGAVLNHDSVLDGTICSVAEPVATRAAKAALYDRLRCDAVDMESATVAQTAALSDVPFIALRVVADPAWCQLPPAALQALTEQGGVSPRAALVGVAAAPWQLPNLIRVGIHTARARRALRRMLAVAGDALCAVSVIEKL